MVSGYLVVASPGRVGRVWGDTLRSAARGLEPIVYRGMDRDPWLDVDELGGACLGRTLQEARRAMARQDDAFSPGVCPDKAIAEAMLCAIPSGTHEAELIWIDNAGAVPPHDLAFLGYDCFVDGFGSPLRLGMYTKPEGFADAVGMVNAHGLCPARAALDDYLGLYHARYAEAVLETIDARMVSEQCMFRVFGRVGC